MAPPLPLQHEQLVAEYSGDSSAKTLDAGDKEPIQVALLDVAIDDKYEPKLVRENGRVKVVVEADLNGIEVNHHPYPNPKVVLLDAAQTEQVDTIGRSTGFLPQGTPTSFPPKGDEVDVPTVIFGGDDRVVFHDTSYPWRLTGRIQTAVGSGSGCMIGPRHVLTASHCVNWAADGSAGWITFSPGYYNGPGPWGTSGATSVYAYRKNIGPLTDEQTAFDYAVLVLDRRIGDTIGWAGCRAFDNSWVNTARWTFVGYPWDLTETQRPAYQNGVIVTSKQDFTWQGRTGSVLGHFSDITAGMFGGPLFGTLAGETGPRVVGVCSTREGPRIPFPDGSTTQDNEFGGGEALVSLIRQALTEAP